MAEKRSSNGDELAGVENVFEKNFNKFNNILSHSDASEQLAQIKTRLKAGGQGSQAAGSDSRHRKAQISRVRKQIQKQKRKQRQSMVNGLHGTGKQPVKKAPIAHVTKPRT